MKAYTWQNEGVYGAKTFYRRKGEKKFEQLFQPMGPLARYVKLWVAQHRECRERFSPPLRVSDTDMHHGTCVTRLTWYLPRSITIGFLWSWWRGKRSRHSRRMCNLQFCISRKRPINKSIIHPMEEQMAEWMEKWIEEYKLMVKRMCEAFTYLPLEYMAAISQTKFSYVFW